MIQHLIQHLNQLLNNKKIKHKASLLILRKHFVNEIENDKKSINNEIFKKYFGYQNPSCLVKNLHKANQVKNEQIVNQVNDSLIDLNDAVYKKLITENENSDKILHFNKQQKGKGVKTFS